MPSAEVLGSGAPLREGQVKASANPSRPPTRFVELDALRGVAAMLVVLVHYAGYTDEARKSHSRTMFLLRPLLAGHEAVILFFLLSGFVLSLSTWKGSVLPYKDYFVRRLFRIYVPYLGALALAVAGCAVFHHDAHSNIPWTYRTWSQPPSLRTVLQHIAFIGDYDVQRYNMPFWSLVVEMRVSLIFPFVCLALRSLRTGVAVALAAAISAAAIALMAVYPAGTSWYGSLHYLSFFILGALLARRLNRRPWPSIPEGVRHAMVPVCILIFAYATTLRRFTLRWPDGVSTNVLDWPVAAGALGLIYLAATHHATRRTLGHFIPRYLGHISYSLYLIHNLVLMALVTLLYNHISIVLLFPIYLILAIGLSALFNRLVEMPAMEMGRRLTRPRSRPAAVSI